MPILGLLLSSLATCCQIQSNSDANCMCKYCDGHAAALWFIRHNYMQIGQIVRPTRNLMQFRCKPPTDSNRSSFATSAALHPLASHPPPLWWPPDSPAAPQLMTRKQRRWWAAPAVVVHQHKYQCQQHAATNWGIAPVTTCNISMRLLSPPAVHGPWCGGVWVIGQVI